MRDTARRPALDVRMLTLLGISLRWFFAGLFVAAALVCFYAAWKAEKLK